MKTCGRPTVLVLCADDPGAPRPDLPHVAPYADIVLATGEDVSGRLGGADVVLVWDAFSPALRHAWHAAERVTWVHAASSGVDALLFPALVTSDVVVTNSRGVFDRPIAEYVLAYVLAFAKDVAMTLDLQRTREWRHRETEMIAGKRVTVIGTGSVGRAIARLLRHAGMEVVGVGRAARMDDEDFGSVCAAAQLHDVLPDADYVIVAAPLTDLTRGMVDAAALSVLRPTARLVNVGRGPVVDQDALVAALQEGRLAGAALDVFDAEPLAVDSALWRDVPGLIVSPHMSGDAIGWQDRLAAAFETNFERWRSGDPLLDVVDKRLGFVPSRAATGRR